MVRVETVDRDTHNADYALKRGSTRDVIYFTTYRKHGTSDIAFYSGNTMTGIVRTVDTFDLRKMIEKAEGDSEWLFPAVFRSSSGIRTASQLRTAYKN